MKVFRHPIFFRSLWIRLAPLLLTSIYLPESTGTDPMPCPIQGSSLGQLTRNCNLILEASQSGMRAVLPLQDRFWCSPDRCNGCWTKEPWKNKEDANLCSHPEFAQMSTLRRAEHIKNESRLLLEAHGLSGTYSPDIFVCLTYRESLFYPASLSSTTVRGLGQVQNSTTRGLFEHYIRTGRPPNLNLHTQGFKDLAKEAENCLSPADCKAPGIEQCQNERRACRHRVADQLHDRMILSPLAQLELTILVFHVKRLELQRERGRIPTRSEILRSYNGNPRLMPGGDISFQDHYAKHVEDCVECLTRRGLTQICLDTARGEPRNQPVTPSLQRRSSQVHPEPENREEALRLQNIALAQRGR